MTINLSLTTGHTPPSDCVQVAILAGPGSGGHAPRNRILNHQTGYFYFGTIGDYSFGTDNEAVRQEYEVRFTTAGSLLGSLYAARANGTHGRRFRLLARVDLLIVDDFALKPLQPPADEDFHDLIAERYERAATIITSNLHFTEWGDAFPNKLLGAATLDRLRHGAYRLILDGKSYRSPRATESPGPNDSPDPEPGPH